MGEAKRRGTYQQRREKAIEAALNAELDRVARYKERVEMRAVSYAIKKSSQWLAVAAALEACHSQEGAK